jgi:hypothetical protein
MPDHQGVVNFPHGAGFELRLQEAIGLLMLGDEQHPGGLLVQAVHQARPQHPSDPLQIRTMSQDGVDQGAGGMPRPGMHDHPGRLVDHQDVGVLIEDVQRDGLRG